MTEIVVSKFARYPFGRYRSDGPYSGEQFREDILQPALGRGEKVRVVLDGAIGMGSSFLDEAFGGLVRMSGYAADELDRRLEIVSNSDPALATEIFGYIHEAAPHIPQNVRRRA